jgi:peroxiredoxin
MIRSMFVFLACFAFVAASPVKSGYDIGDVVADFKLKNVTGQLVSLSDYKDRKGVIVIFDCNTCPYSKAYNERIIALNKKYAPSGFPVITIQPNDPAQSPGDSFEAMVKQAEKKRYEFPYLLDDTQVVSRAFGATNTPHSFVLKNEGGSFKVAYIGAIDDSSRDAAGAKKKYVEDAVDALLNGKEVPTVSTKAVGCSIKWKSA